MWSFIHTEDASKKIYVVGLQSARLVAALFSKAELAKWRVRSYENKPFRPMLDCTELFPSDNLKSSEFTRTPVVKPADILKAFGDRLPEKTEVSVAWQEPKESSVVYSKPIKAPAESKVIITSPNVEVPKSEGNDISRRKNKRVNAKLRVILFFDKKVFRTHTRNISIGGLFLDKLLPADLVGKKCKVVLGSLDNQTNIEFKGVFKELGQSGTRIVFEREQVQEQLKHLTSWIEGAGQFTGREQQTISGIRKAV